ncbi:efflux transporter outer membrane subunit [Pseudomonas sp. LRF_L74]|uniref:efflux transporter outer membrane subunit n=1 Tax=Pseudomonas sp. LRF_L74 TaxID=3369422 RepID=UPI003F62383D
MTRHALLVLASLILGACSLGTDFVKPEPVLASRWALPIGDEVNSQAVEGEVQARWWDTFNDPQLSALIQRVAKDNLDLQLAASRLEQSRAARIGTAADEWPDLNGTAGYSRSRNSQNGLSDPSGHSGKSAYNLWQAGFDSSWELDLWGRVRRQVEAADAAVQVSVEELHGVRLMVMADTARNYIQLRGTQRSLAIVEQNLQIARRTLGLNQTRLADGVATQLEVAEAAAQVAAIEARLPPLQQHQARLINALSLLLGEPPQALQSDVQTAAALPKGPARIPVGLPSELAQRRPDIRRAEAALHGAIAQVGVAQADFYPRITLDGNVGLQSLQLSDLGWDSRRFAFGPSLSVPLFDGGRLRGALQLREAHQQEAAILYRKTVLAAWHEVDDALMAYRSEQRRYASLEQAVGQTRQALDNAEQQYAQGTVDFLNVLSVQNTLLANQAALVDSDSQVSLALVDLYKALGGGWQADALSATVH